MGPLSFLVVSVCAKNTFPTLIDIIGLMLKKEAYRYLLTVLSMISLNTNKNEISGVVMIIPFIIFQFF